MLPDIYRGLGSLKRIRVVEPIIDDNDVEKVVNVLKSGWLAHGPVVEEFERRFADFVGVKHGIAVSSGTAALKIMLLAAGLGPGDEVVVPCFTFTATANVVVAIGARPVFADIELETYTINIDDVLEKITPRTRAIIAVHLYGHPADMKSLREVAADHKLILLEDAAQAHGARCPEGMVGSLGEAAAFSFYATKNMTTGEGGMITTNNDKIAYVAQLLRNHGQERKYYHVMLGENYRMTSIAAALGLTQLEKLNILNERRRHNARLLSELLSNTGLVLPMEKPGYKHVYHQYVVRVDPERVGIDRDVLAKQLHKYGIETAIHYPLPIPDQPFYRSLVYPPASILGPNALLASNQVLSLPVHPKLTEEDIKYIAEAINKILSQG